MNKAVLSGTVSRSGAYATDGVTTFTLELVVADAPVELEGRPTCVLAIHRNAVADYRTLAFLSLVAKEDSLRLELDGGAADSHVLVERLHSLQRIPVTWR